MANKKEAKLVLKGKDQGASSTIKGISGVMDKFVITAGDVVNGLKRIGQAGIEFARLGGEVTAVRQAFANLAAGQGQDARQMLAQMRELSAGTVNDLDLMKQANNALLLGLPVDRFGDMLKIARSAAKATGESMDFMLKSIVTGLGRGSKLMLDNLGILVDTNAAYKTYAQTLGKTADQLTDAERKQAFINEALRVGTENAEMAGAGAMTLGERMDRLAATFNNVKQSLSVQLGPAFGLVVTEIEALAAASQKTFGKNWVVDVIDSVALSISGLIGGFKVLGARIGIGLATNVERFKAIMRGDFDEARQIVKDGVAEINRIHEEADQQHLEKKRELQEQRVQLEEQAFEADMERVNAQNAAKAEAQALADEQALLNMDVKNQKELIKEMTHQRILRDSKLKEQLKTLNLQIKNEADTTKRLALEHKKRIFMEQQQDLTKRKMLTKFQQFEEFINSQKVKNTQSTLGMIATLQQSGNKRLAAIGRAAAIANAIINTAQGITAAWALGPILGPILAPVVAVAGAAQIATISGVQLAEGGIVRATPGGVQATIGEAGQDEAVIPLDDEDEGLDSRVGGGGNTYVFQGPVMGDENQAREFALMMDQELLKLRQDNESDAFDQDVI